MRSPFFVLTVRQRFHLWCSRGKKHLVVAFCCCSGSVFSKPLQIFGFENYSTDRFYPGKPSNNLHCEHMYSKIHIYCFCYCLLFSKVSFCTLSLYWIGSMMLWQTSRLGFFMNMTLLLIFMLVQSAPFIVFSTIFQRLCSPTTLFEGHYNGIISSSLPVSCSSILPAHSWFSLQVVCICWESLAMGP